MTKEIQTQRGLSPKAQTRIVIGALVLFCLAGLALMPQVVVYMMTYDSVAEMAANANPQSFVFRSGYTRGYYAPGDGGAGFYFPTNTVSGTNVGTRIKALIGNGAWSWELNCNRGRLNIRQFGGKGNGTFNDTPAINAMQDALPSSGGEIELPADGEWTYNFVITKANLTLSGQSHVVDFGGTNRSRCIPADNTKYVITVGNDSGFVKGVVIRGLTLDGKGVGHGGVSFAGGAVECAFENSTVSFFTNCINLPGPTNYPVSIVRVSRVDWQPSNVANARGIYVGQAANYPTSWVTEINFNEGHYNGPSSGANSYAIEIDSAEVKMVNLYGDTTDGHSWKISHNLTPFPWIDAINCNADTGLSTRVAIEGYANTRIFAGLATINCQINGKYKELDGTLMQPPPSHLRQNSLLVSPTVYGALSLLRAGGVGFVGGTYTNTQFVVDAAGNVYLTSEGIVTFRNGSGLVQIDSPPGTAISYLRLYDALNNRSADIRTSGGDIEIWPAPGSTGVKIMDTNGTVRIQVNPSGGIFLTGTGLGANTSGLYLDSNSQVKSVAGATATLDFPSTSAQSSSDLPVTVTGAAVNDGVVVDPPAAVNANTSYTAWVSAADTVTVRFNNYSSAAVDPSSATFKVKILK